MPDSWDYATGPTLRSRRSVSLRRSCATPQSPPSCGLDLSPLRNPSLPSDALDLTLLKRSLAWLQILVLVAVFAAAVGCADLQKLTEPNPLEGEDVNVHSLADGQIEFRMKITGLTSTLWVTTEVVNKSLKNISFDSKNLLVFADPSCLADHEFESPANPTLRPNERKLLHYSFQIFANKKNSPEYLRCKKQPLKFTIAGLTLDGIAVKPLTLTIQNDEK